MIPLWYSLPAIVAVLSGVCVFLFCRHPRSFHIFMGFTLVFDGLFTALSGLVLYKLERFDCPIYLLRTGMMLLCPFFYYFATIFLLKEEGVRKKDFWLLEIVGVFIIVFAAVISNIPQEELNHFQRIISPLSPVPDKVSTGTAVMLALDDTAFLFFLAEQLFIQIFCFINLNRYRKLLENWFSSNGGKSVGSIFLVICLVAARFMVYAIMSFVPPASNSEWFHIIQAALFCAFFIVIACFILNISYTAEELARLTAAQDAKRQPPVANELIKTRMEELIRDRFFLDPDIDLITTAERIHINSKYLSEFLKYYYGETFMVFVNRKRIEYAAALISEGKLGMPDIAERSGFVSESTFYRNFVKTMGITPSKFKKNA